MGRNPKIDYQIMSDEYDESITSNKINIDYVILTHINSILKFTVIAYRNPKPFMDMVNALNSCSLWMADQEYFDDIKKIESKFDSLEFKASNLEKKKESEKLYFKVANMKFEAIMNMLARKGLFGNRTIPYTPKDKQQK